MKKSIFDLNYDEGKKIEYDLRKTSYGRQYFVISHFVLIVVFLILFVSILLGIVDGSFFEKNIICLMMFLVLSVYIYIICKLKWFDLIKKYYDTEHKKNKSN